MTTAHAEYLDNLAFVSAVLAALPDLALSAFDANDMLFDSELPAGFVLDDTKPVRLNDNHFAFIVNYNAPTSAYSIVCFIEYNPDDASVLLCDTESGNLDNPERHDSIRAAFVAVLAGLIQTNLD